MTPEQRWRIELIHHIVQERCVTLQHVAQRRINLVKALTNLIAKGNLGHRVGTAQTRVTNQDIFDLAAPLFTMKKISKGPPQMISTCLDVWNRYGKDHGFEPLSSTCSGDTHGKKEYLATSKTERFVPIFFVFNEFMQGTHSPGINYVVGIYLWTPGLVDKSKSISLQKILSFFQNTYLNLFK